MKSAQADNEPSAELQQLANSFVNNHPNPGLPRNELLSDWCEHLQSSSPETLDLPVLQLIKAIIRTGRYRTSFVNRLHRPAGTSGGVVQY